MLIQELTEEDHIPRSGDRGNVIIVCSAYHIEDSLLLKNVLLVVLGVEAITEYPGF